MIPMVFALIGNQNCGKTTLFNQLTGSNQHVGNFPGVTVEKKEGFIKKKRFPHNDKISVVDLPGIYSLSPYTSEEVVTRDFLIHGNIDCIINIVDASNIERNLYLTLQLMELGRPMVLALNMMDEIRQNGISIDIDKLSDELTIPAVPISAIRNEGISELIDKTIETANTNAAPQRLDFCTGAVHKAIHALAHIIYDTAETKGIPLRYASTKLVEGDEITMNALELTENERDIVGHIVSDMEKELGTDREAALADMRYEYIEVLCKKVVTKTGDSKEYVRSLKIDTVLTHKFWAIPIFLGIMMLIFYLTFSVFGDALSSLMSMLIDSVTMFTENALISLEVNETIRSLIIDGIFSGVGSVLSFLPTIIVLFFFLSILEDTGYMARVAFVMDKLLRKIGLSGRSFVPMLIGFGCSVPAIMATRTLPSERDRKMTIILTPFMSCSAKLPIYALFSAAFFQENQALVMISLYIMSIVVGILYALILKKTIYRGNPVPFVMELPTYRFPSPKSVIIHIWEKAKDFFVKAFTIIFMATIVIWLLQSFDHKLNLVHDSSDSLLAMIGQFIAPIFTPLGFGTWEASTALVTGLTAKEAVVSTLAILTNAGDRETLKLLLPTLFTPLQSFAFLTFSLLYMPCVAAMAAVKREIGSILKAAGIMAAQTGIAWIVTFIVYNVGSLFV
ncbi:MAG: ferrous iron transport protein B [Clostridiales bacterium]|nr:ferrous iron transport protein B [Clostridiales bacterium]